MTGKGKVLGNSLLYTLSSLLVKAIGFLLLPVYTLFLTPEDYGITNLINGFTGVATYIVSFSLYSALIRFYTNYKDDINKLKRFYGTIIIFVFCSGCLFCGFGLLIKELLVKSFFEGIAFYPAVFIALLSTIFICLHTVHQSIMQGMQAGKKLTIINLIVFVLTVCFNLLFITLLKLGAVGVLFATLVINLLYSIYMLMDLKANGLVTFCIDLVMLKESLKYSIPLMPHNLSTHIASFASRVFINIKGSLASVGLYSVASQFGIIIDTVQASVNKAFSPWFFEIMSQNNSSAKREIIYLSRFLLILYSLLYMLIGLFSQEVLILMTSKKYIMAWTAIPIFVIAYSVKSIYYFYINVLFYYKEAANKIFIASVTGSLMDITLAVTLVPNYGLYGAAIAFLIAKVIVVTIIVLISKRYEDVGYKLYDMLKIIIPSILFMVIGLYFSYTKYLEVFCWLNLLYKLFILASYLVFLFITNKNIINRILQSNKFKMFLRQIKKK